MNKSIITKFMAGAVALSTVSCEKRGAIHQVSDKVKYPIIERVDSFAKSSLNKADTTDLEKFAVDTLEITNKNMNNKIRGDRDEVLYFLKDFNVPSTNNNAESSQRGVKIKQKIGKFRSINGSENYLRIKSCILTYKKHNKDILNALINAFEGKNIVAL